MTDPIIVPDPAPEPPVDRQEDNVKPPLDDVDDVQWLDENDPRRKEIEAFQSQPEDPAAA